MFFVNSVRLFEFLISREITFYIFGKVSRYGVFSGAYFSVFGPNAEKYGPEKTLYLDTFHVADFKQLFTVFTGFCLKSVWKRRL